MALEDLVSRLLAGDETLFEGITAGHALGWLRHPERYLGGWLDETAERLPRRHARTILLGMGGSSSPARLYAEARPECDLVVLDTSNPDTIAGTDFAGATVIASSKSGSTIETQTLLAHALANGLVAEDLVIISDPGTAMVELARSLRAHVIEGDPDTGGRFSGLSPFGLVPALCGGWSVDELRGELAECSLSQSLIETAAREAATRDRDTTDGRSFFELGGDPMSSGGALWLEQLVAESTGKEGRGFIPIVAGASNIPRPRDMMRLQVMAALLARRLNVDPFNQPDVESAKRDVFSLLQSDVSWEVPAYNLDALREALFRSTYNVLQIYAPLEATAALSTLRQRVEARYGATTANLGPRYLHSTGQLHKGGPAGVVAVQIVQRPRTPPQRIKGRRYSFHDLHMAQARSDVRAMSRARRTAVQILVDDLDEAAQLLGV